MLLSIVDFGSSSLNETKGKYHYDANVSPRLQWLSNEGYCGEVSLIMTGLKYGQYISQYDMREISAVCPDVAKCKVQEQRFYLVGENDQRASKLVKLDAIEWDFTDLSIGHTMSHLAWIKVSLF